MSKLGFFPDTWMGRGFRVSGDPPLVDTFLMARRHTIWPILNTAETGTWAWSGDAGKMFGGTYTNTSNTANDSISFDNLNLFSAAAAINLLYTKASTGGLCDVYWGTKGEAGDLLATIDMYAASTQKNQVAQFSLGTVTKARKALHFVMRAGTGGGYTCQIQQAEVVQLTGDNTGASIDDLPWWVDIPPFAYSAGTGPFTLTQSTSQARGSFVRWSDALNEYTEAKVGLYPGTWQQVATCVHGSSGAVGTLTIDGGSSLGTFDTYNGSTTYNNKSTISSIPVTTAGVKTARITATSQNPSSGGYNLDISWLQYRKTAAHGAITATGATYGRESAELWPWFWDSNTNFDTIALSGNSLYYGYAQTDGNQFDSGASEINLLSGAYRVDLVSHLGTNRGVVHMSLDGGADIDTVDTRNGGTSWNQSMSMSGSLSPGSLEFSMDSTSGSAYFLVVSQIRLTRTGA